MLSQTLSVSCKADVGRNQNLVKASAMSTWFWTAQEEGSNGEKQHCQRRHQPGVVDAHIHDDPANCEQNHGRYLAGAGND